MPKDSRSSGRRGEDLACRFLKKDKYKILEKNYRSRQGEIDIIAEDRKGVLVTHSKQKKLLATAFIYLETNKMESKDMRFDIVSVNLKNEETQIIKNAFDVNYY